MHTGPHSPSPQPAAPGGGGGGGGLQFTPPASYDLLRTPVGLVFLDDARGDCAEVEEDWYSGMSVGAVQWQPGVEYPGAETASQRILSCCFSASIWGGHQGRSLGDEVIALEALTGIG